jgi:hypothetical protein
VHCDEVMWVNDIAIRCRIQQPCSYSPRWIFMHKVHKTRMVAGEGRWILGVWVPDAGTYTGCWIWTSENAYSRTLVNKHKEKS